jgi:OOP family OmpA-OmpF porin
MMLVVISNVFSQSKYNRWSIEPSVGPKKPMGPLIPGFLSPTLNLGHADLGLQYMINDYYGFNGNLGRGSFSEAAGVSLEFTTNYFRLNIQAVGNIGKMLDLPSVSRKLGTLAR